MSQNLTPVENASGVSGITPQLTTTVNQQRIKIFSQEYKDTKGLVLQPTEWNPVGRPIYGRLPAASEQYQLDFFEEGGRGYVLIPRGNDLFGPGSLYVNQSENREVLLIENGDIVWEEGTTPVYKTFVDFRELGVEDGRYLVCYQLIYDNEPQPLLFQVEDYCLAGLDFSVTDSASQNFERSADDANPWPFPGLNMFAFAEQGVEWKNYIDLVNRSPGAQAGVKPGFPDYEQPLLSSVEWESAYPWKLDVIKVRTTLVEKIPSCSLYIESPDPDIVWELVQQAVPLKDSDGYYWEFQTDLVPQQKWKLDWGPTTKVNASKLTVSGLLTIPTKPSAPRPRAQLAIYPTNLVPEDESLCRLAIINVDNFQIPYRPTGELWKDDIREIINRDYEPVANWLTQYWDEQLISLWSEVKAFTPGYMAPPTLLKQSYASLEKYGITVDGAPPPYPPSPPTPTVASFVGASVSLVPPLPDVTTLASVSVDFEVPLNPPQITDIIIDVVTP